MKNKILDKIKVIRGDITTIKADVIVNAANSSLMGGGGVDGAIHNAGGPAILFDCMKIVEKQGGCKTGEAVITRSGNLPSKYVIHTVGPIWRYGNNNEIQLLKNCYFNSLLLAIKNGCRSVAFPAISTGIYRFPKELAAGIAVEEVHSFLSQKSLIEQVIFVCFDDENYKFISQQIQKLTD